MERWIALPLATVVGGWGGGGGCGFKFVLVFGGGGGCGLFIYIFIFIYLFLNYFSVLKSYNAWTHSVPRILQRKKRKESILFHISQNV